ncbi:AraC family transcriptional regulator [Paenibacillus sp. YYML68]|uniref:helix-turn-helix transcriptional regulator n=1 Tax=Paenibacillus sp. YYML68 TaxID=2909250 RepID=UPI002492AFA4|nr:AraC family transcriptional regulator [Paenibacillus sp. YYML68]
MNPPETMKHGRMTDPFYFEYIRRDASYNMMVNHYHPFYEIYYLLSGERMYFIKDTSYRIQSGDLVFIPKNDVHKTRDAKQPAHERMIIHFDDRFIHSMAAPQAKFLLSPFHHSTPVLRLPEKERALIHAHMQRTLDELAVKSTGYELYLASVVTDLLLIASRTLEQQQPVEVSHAAPMHKKISEVIRFLNVSFAEPLHLQMIADKFFISPYYLSRMFKEMTGFTLIDYLNLTRIREAQRLLRETDRKITDIASMVGFENFSHFGKTFKKMTRTSARDYRQQQKAAPRS